MQIIRSSRECKWVSECRYCGCAFIYTQEDIMVRELPDRDENFARILADRNEEAPHKRIFFVQCPECQQEVQVSSMACYRKQAVRRSEDWEEMDEYDGC